MSLPSINQVRHLFVALTEKAYDASLANVGDLKISGKENSDEDGVTGPFRFQQIGYGGLVASDTIKPKNILNATLVKAAKMKEKLGVHTVTVTQAAAGQIYEIQLRFHQFIGEGAQDQTPRLGTYKAKTGETAAQIAAGLAASLQSALGLDDAANAANVAHYREPFCTVTVTGAVITIKEVMQEWVLGRFPVAHMPITVSLGGIYTEEDYETFDWATIAHSVELSSLVVVSQKIADLEYFAMGARGDEYRGMGYPRNIETKYMVNPAETDGYDLLNIHYAYVGSNESVQKSEKDITIVLPAAESHQIITDLTPLLEEAGVELEVISA